MKLASLQEDVFSANLRKGGVALRFGVFTARITCGLPELAKPIHTLYAEFPLIQDPDKEFIDYPVSLRGLRPERPFGERRARFFFEGAHVSKPFPRRMSLAFFEWGLNSCIYNYAHQYLMFHAAVVERAGKALLLAGVPGAGKSTLCAGLIHRGWRLLSDELALLDPKARCLVGTARPVSLKNRSIDLVRQFAPDAVMGPKIHETHKGTVAHLVPPPASIARQSEPAVPAWIVFPRYQEGAPLQLIELPKSRAFFRLAENSFNYDLLHETGFQVTRDLVASCGCFELRQSSLEESIAALDAL